MGGLWPFFLEYLATVVNLELSNRDGSARVGVLDDHPKFGLLNLVIEAREPARVRRVD